MRHGKKWMTVSGALLVSCVLSSCEMPRTISAWLGDERTLPDGAQVNFGKPRRPVLNPLNNYPPQSDNDTIARSAPPVPVTQNIQQIRQAPSAIVAQPPAVAPAQASIPAGRRVPVENMAILSGGAAPQAVPAPMTSAPGMAQAETSPAMPPSAPVAAAAIPVHTASAPATVADDWSKPAGEKLPVAPLLSDPAPPSASGALPETATPAGREPLKLIPPSAPKPADDVASAVPAQPAPAQPAPAQAGLAMPAAAMPAAPVNPEPATPTASAAEAQAIAAAAAQASEPAPAPLAQPAAQAPVASLAAPEASAPQQAVDEAMNKTPSLASVPEAPARTPATKIESDISELNAQRESSQANSRALMENNTSTVMTSAETGKLVPDAAKAQPSDTSEKGFTGWLHSITSGDKPAAETAPAQEKVAQSAPVVPSAEAEKDLTVPPYAGDMAKAKAVSPEELAEAPKAASSEAASAPAPSTAEPTPAAAPALAAEKPAEQATPSSSATALKLTPPRSAPSESAAPAPVAKAEEPAMPAPVANAAPVQVETAPAIAESSPADAKKQLSAVINDAGPDATQEPVQYLPDSRYNKRRLPPINESY